MAHPKNFAPQGYEHTVRAIRFLLYPNGTGTPTVLGMGVSAVSRADTGLFLVTLMDAHRHCTKFHPHLVVAGESTDLYAQGGTVGNLASGNPVTAHVRLKTGSTNTDAAAAATTFISVEMVFDDSAVVLG